MPCGQSIRTAAQKYIAGQHAYLTALRAWSDDKRAKLEPAMQKDSLSSACGPAEACGRPYTSQFDDADGKALSLVECTGQIFVCNSLDSSCTLDAVADRLGLSGRPAVTDPPLRVRGSGSVVKP